jgi:hypothetical protein
MAAGLLGMGPSDFAKRFLSPLPGGGWSVRSGPSKGDPCLLLGEDGLCRIQGAKPDVCRAWPYLRAPLGSEGAFLELRGCCQGLSGLTWRDFLKGFEEPGAAPPGDAPPTGGFRALARAIGGPWAF